jgi:hypothetical protein
MQATRPQHTCCECAALTMALAASTRRRFTQRESSLAVAASAAGARSRSWRLCMDARRTRAGVQVDTRNARCGSMCRRGERSGAATAHASAVCGAASSAGHGSGSDGSTGSAGAAGCGEQGPTTANARCAHLESSCSSIASAPGSSLSGRCCMRSERPCRRRG